MQRSAAAAAAILVVTAWSLSPAHGAGAAGARGGLHLTGVNIAGAEFGGRKIPGRHGTDYFYPTRAGIDAFIAKGLRTLRVPFRWERMQRALNGALDAEEARLLDDTVAYATQRGATVVLDVHNYASFAGQPIGSADVPTDALADLWRRLAARYKDNGRVVFGLMNEPKGLPTETWLAAANQAIAAIRGSGARNLVLVPGNGWSGAHSWFSRAYGTPNAAVMQRIADPADNFAYELHQYLDKDFSGTRAACRSAGIGAQALEKVTQWLRQNRRRGFLGEFGAGGDATCLAALEGMLAFMAQHDDVWIGWTYWAAGPWPRDYFTSLEPVDGVDPPQLAVLLRYAARAPAAGATHGTR